MFTLSSVSYSNLLQFLIQKREDSIKVEEKVERPVKKEKTLEEIKEARMFDFTEKRDVPNHDLEKPNNDNDIKANDKLEEQDRSKEQSTKSSNPSVEKTGNMILFFKICIQ